MYLLSDVITYVRRLIKSPSDAQITDNLIIDYINRFYTADMDARIQLFDLKSTYQFQTTPGIDKYNMPVYSLQAQPGGSISYYPIYQNVEPYASVNGIQVPFYTQKEAFYSIWPNYVQALPEAATASGAGPYSLSLPFFPAIPGHLDMSGYIAAKTAQPVVLGTKSDPLFLTSAEANAVIPVTGCIFPNTSIGVGVTISTATASGANTIITDSGLFFADSTDGQLRGLLVAPGSAPYGTKGMAAYNATTNIVNYTTGFVNFTFDAVPLTGAPINIQCYFYEQGLPRALLFYNNSITLRNPPDQQYNISLNAYLTPAAFLSTSAAIPFAYMSEYIARGAARKILSDTGDVEQFQFYEPLFREQEMLVWKRSQRVFTSSRTQTIFSETGIGNLSTNMTQGGT